MKINLAQVSFLLLVVTICESFTPIRCIRSNWSHFRTIILSASPLSQDKTSDQEKTNDDFLDCEHDRRSLIHAACWFSALVLHPTSALSREAVTPTEVEPNLDCLLDLPPVPVDFVRIYLCRHGQTENNRLRKVQGARIDPPINDNGILQAINLGKALARVDPRPQAFFCSNLQRAKTTAEISASEISRKIKPRELSSLREVDFGPVAEGQSVALAKVGMEATTTAWAIGNIDYHPEGGGDSGRNVLVRAVESLNTLAREAQASKTNCAVAVSHSFFLKVLLGVVMDEPLAEAAIRKLANGGVTVLDIRKDKKSTRRLGPKPKLLGGPFSQVPPDFHLLIPICNVVRINECRHLPS